MDFFKSSSKELMSDSDQPFLRSSTRSLNLDEVLRSEFRAAYVAEQEVNRQPSGMTELSQVEVFSSEGNDECLYCSQFVDSYSFMTVFLVLTACVSTSFSPRIWTPSLAPFSPDSC
ncbi:unnamed protein product [Durusdinium trenchii]|uniref:Uncharacterized protein n=1 Tax=Durusdinium trenchii TaxID=1381693 RepID=A0ABP0R0X6_9DINO